MKAHLHLQVGVLTPPLFIQTLNKETTFTISSHNKDKTPWSLLFRFNLVACLDNTTVWSVWQNRCETIFFFTAVPQGFQTNYRTAVFWLWCFKTNNLFTVFLPFPRFSGHSQRWKSWASPMFADRLIHIVKKILKTPISYWLNLHVILLHFYFTFL